MAPTSTEMSALLRRWRTAFALVVAVAVLSACGDDGGGITQPDATVLTGSVVEAGTEVLLPDVLVGLGERTTRSNDRGQYRFEDLSPGDQVTLTASESGYLPYERTLILEQGTNVFDIALLPVD